MFWTMVDDEDRIAWQRRQRTLEFINNDISTLFQYIQPVSVLHDNVYSVALRKMLFYVCSEIESQMRGILRVNGYSKGKPEGWGTRDYVQLKEPMKLGDYSFTLLDEPTLKDEMFPFRDWSDEKGLATKTLPWYDAYNAAKHEAVQNEHRATFKNVILACGALQILAHAQSGALVSESSKHFRIEGNPVFSRDELYWSSVMGRYEFKPLPYFAEQWPDVNPPIVALPPHPTSFQ